MRYLILLFAVLMAVPAVAGDTEEFEYTISGTSATVQLSDTFSHFQISATNPAQVRFVIPLINPQGTVLGPQFMPKGGTDPAGTGPRPDQADTTLTISDTVLWNVFNDISGRKLNLSSATNGTVFTVRCKK